MARRRFGRRIRRRSSPRMTRTHRRRGFTAVKALKAFIAFAPAAGKAINDTEANGGFTSKTGITRGLIPSLSTSYTGYNTNDGKFYAEDLAYGYVPILAVIAGEKLGVFKTIGRFL